MNQAVIPYNPYQPGVIPQTGVIPPTYVGGNTAAEYYYPQPVYSGYPSAGYDYSLGQYSPGYIPRSGGRLRYPRKRGRLARVAEALFLGSGQDRLRMLELQAMSPELGYGGMYGRGIMPGMGMMDDAYGYYGGAGMHQRSMGYHRRGCPCVECLYEDYY
jgi:hypothetical protein